MTTTLIPEGITENDVREALAALDAGVKHPFGDSTGYDLVEAGRRYPPKAVYGLAAQRLAGKPLGPYDFKGGEKSQCFRVLRRLGFQIEPKPLRSGQESDWTEEEIRDVVELYFSIYLDHKQQRNVNKSELVKGLAAHLRNRTAKAIEYKLQNVSGVLHDLDLPWLPGYAPAKNYQRKIFPDIVLEFVSEHQQSLQELVRRVDSDSTNPPSEIDYLNCEVPPPLQEVGDRSQKPKLGRVGRKFDRAARDRANKELGCRGEEFVLQVERLLLESSGRSDLAQRVEWVSETEGDGLGYDIRSFEPSTGAPRFLEVKTTNGDAYTRFFISANEVAVSRELGSSYQLIRVYEFSSGPKFYRMVGGVEANFDLTPKLYEARLTPATSR